MSARRVTGDSQPSYNIQVPAVNPPASPLRSKPFADPVIFGTLCGLASALCYTAANTCLRAVSHCDPIWVSAFKALPTVLLVGPWLFVRGWRQERIFPPWKTFGLIVFAGVVGQLLGNVSFQWSLGIVGMALVVPSSLGAMIVTGPLLGRVFLGEPITVRAAVSIIILASAVFVLFLGASRSAESQAAPAIASQPSVFLVSAGIAAACLSGFAYTVLGVVIRYGVTGHASLSITLVTVGLVGVIGLGGLSLARIGPAEMLATAWPDLAIMLLAGICNAAAFLTLTKSLQLSPIVYAGALNATQAAMAIAVGALVFWEPVTVSMMVGLGLTIFGLVLMRGGRKRKEPVDPVDLMGETPHAAE